MATKILIYDDKCTLCTWYSGLFVKTGLLKPGGRQPFSTLEPALLQKIDFARGRNEIPYLDTETGKVLYGIDAMVDIIGQRCPFIKPITRVRPLKWILERVYRLISFNRKIIIAKRCGPGRVDCAPDLNYFYRLLFMVCGLIFNTVMLYSVHRQILAPLPYYHLSVTELQTIHSGFAFVNCSLALSFRKEKAFEYLGQVNLLAITTILLLIPLLLINTFDTPAFITTAWLVLVAIIVFREYLRRMIYAGVLPSYTLVPGIDLASLAGFILLLFN